MCNCLNETINKLKEIYPDAEDISFNNIELLSGKIYSSVGIKLPNKKKPKEQLLLHSYCPICGQKYE